MSWISSFSFFCEGQFDSVFLPFIHQRPKFQANCQLWTAYKPNVSSSTGNTLPRLCKKCTKNGKSHVGLDPFPQKSSTAIVWYRINVQDFQGEVKLHFCRINFVKLKKISKFLSDLRPFCARWQTWRNLQMRGLWRFHQLQIHQVRHEVHFRGLGRRNSKANLHHFGLRHQKTQEKPAKNRTKVIGGQPISSENCDFNSRS